MKRKIYNIIKYTLFLLLGLWIFYSVYNDLPIDDLKIVLTEINYWWIAASFVIGMLSHFVRTLRWNMLIHPLGFQPQKTNTFFAIMMMYMVNLAVPRAGEVARCTVLARYEKITVTRLLGTVAIERLADVIALALFALLIIIGHIGLFTEFIQEHDIDDNIMALLTLKNVLYLLVAIVILFSGLLWYSKRRRKIKLGDKLQSLKDQLIEGLRSFKKIRNKRLFVLHTFLIYLLWLLALYVVFFAYEPTQDLSMTNALLVFVMGGLAMIAPVQGGIGAWHFMVMETLFMFGIAKADGKIFALIAHTSTNLGLVIMALIGLIVLPLVNKRKYPVKS